MRKIKVSRQELENLENIATDIVTAEKSIEDLERKINQIDLLGPSGIYSLADIARTFMRIKRVRISMQSFANDVPCTLVQLPKNLKFLSPKELEYINSKLDLLYSNASDIMRLHEIKREILQEENIYLCKWNYSLSKYSVMVELLDLII